MRSEVGAVTLAMLAMAALGCGDSTGASAEGSGTGSSGTAVTLTAPTSSGSDSDVTPTGGSGEQDGGAIKFDLHVADFGAPDCGAGMGDTDFSFIWIANAAQGTISKIDTVSMLERGRYIVRPDSAGSPSRTSVSLTGDVAVANRNGGLTKVYARHERCAESNATPGLQTAGDANFLAWGEEECIAWYTPMAYASQRPAAWTQGTFNPNACRYDDQKVWTAGMNTPGTVDIIRVDGDTGAIEATVTIGGVKADGYGLYGGAVDKQGNFWGSQLGVGKLVFVDYQTLQFKMWDMVADGYGMTVDSKGYVWTCASAASRFDPMTETWQTVGEAGESGGCMEDGKGTLYKSFPGGIAAIDTETLAIKKNYTLPQHVHGISIDFFGYVWGVSQGTDAYRVNAGDGQFQAFTGLVGAYTYSDMTGFALSNVGTPSG